MRLTSRFVLPLAALGLLLPTTAFAGGLEVPDVGTKALGRGSAFTARADNLSAFKYNAAGLSKLKGVNVLLVGGAMNMNVEFDRAGSGGFACPEGFAADGCDPGTQFSNRHFDPQFDPNTGDPYETARNTGRIGPAPMLVAQWGGVGGVEGLAIALGFQTPSGFGSATYSDTGAQRYALRGASSLSGQAGLGVAYRVNRYFSIGATFLAAFTKADFHRAARGLINSEDMANENPEGDTDFRLTVLDPFSPAASIGVLSNPVDWLEIGANVLTPITVEADGSLEMISSEETEGMTELAGNGVTYRTKTPWIVRTGIRYIHKRFDIEVDYVWEGWKNTGTCSFGSEKHVNEDPESDRNVCGSGFEVDFDEDTAVELAGQPIPILDFMVPKNYRNVHQVRVGTDVEVIPKVLAVRTGGWFQTSAFPKNYETFSVDFPIAQQFALSGGLTWKAATRKNPNPKKEDNWLDVNVGYSHVFQPTVVVTEGLLTQRGITTPGTPLVGNVVNNGTYNVSYNLFGVSFEGHF
jgi:long-subunit fatty acid transport protein